jgi:hypothetical protein
MEYIGQPRGRCGLADDWSLDMIDAVQCVNGVNEVGRGVFHYFASFFLSTDIAT